MATFVPFAILRLIPAVEAGAVGHLDGLRQRGTAMMTRAPRTAASYALNGGLEALGDGRLLAQTGAGSPPSGESDTGVNLGEGEPNSERIFDAAVADRMMPGPKGPKPVLAPEAGTDAAVASAGEGDVAASGNADGHDPAERGGGWLAQSTGRKRPPPTGPDGPEDAWKWEGVPPGRSLIGKVDPGEMRYYMDDDGHGPQIRWLPAAWPPDNGSDAE
jgi:hypothetical protein